MLTPCDSQEGSAQGCMCEVPTLFWISCSQMLSFLFPLIMIILFRTFLYFTIYLHIYILKCIVRWANLFYSWNISSHWDSWEDRDFTFSSFRVIQIKNLKFYETSRINRNEDWKQQITTLAEKCNFIQPHICYQVQICHEFTYWKQSLEETF